MRIPILLVAPFITTWWSVAEAQDSPSLAQGPIASAQEQLKQQGYAPGPVNGVMTDKTRRAMMAFRRRTGRLPDALAAAGADPVARAQEALRRLGLFAGAADGTLGPQTRDAIIRFEASRKLPIDPRVSDRLLAELEQAGGTAWTANAPPPPQSDAAPAGSPSAAASATAQLPPGTTPEALGRRPLPAWVNPPPIR
jgi:peptidoglycan hydrolase-like protein with peptidoglycan-binding domain